MRRRLVVGLAAGLVLALGIDGSATSDAPPKTQGASLIDALSLTSGDPLFGGFSAIEVSDNGARLTVVSDRGAFVLGRMRRNAGGRLLSVQFDPVTPLQGALGGENDLGADSEGLAVGTDGQLFVSFEGTNRISRFDRLDNVPVDLPPNPVFARLPENKGLEALAIDDAGTIYTVPEALEGDTSPVYVFRDGAWRDPLSVPRAGNFRPVSADFGPDGRFYLLERRFDGLAGFANRLRRFDLGVTGFSDGVTLLQTTSGRHDNLEGLSVWRSGDGLHATMISDDNFFALQVTEIVEYRLPD